MSGFDSKRRIALDRLDDDDIQVYAKPSSKRPIEADYTSQVAYTRALEAYCDTLAQPDYRAVKTYHEGSPVYVAQPEQEPTAWYDKYGMFTHDPFEGVVPLYTTPQKRPWVGLTENEIEAIEEKALTKQWAIRMALTAVKEKNT